MTGGAVVLARKLNISSWVIGLIIVGVGTSIPEFSIAAISNLLGDAEIALGTVIGSNTFNILVILGISAILFPLRFKEGWIERDLMWNIFAILAASFAGFFSLAGKGDFVITRFEGLLMFILFCVWIYYSLKKPDDTAVDGKLAVTFTLPVVILMVFIGLVGVVLGGKWVVDGAILIARDLGVSEKLIGLTIVGIGTSLPELAVSLTAAYKKQVGIAVGSIIGSNIFDFLMVLGFSSMMAPITFASELYLDIWITFMAATLLLTTMFVGKKYVLTRTKGAILIALYLVYFIYLAVRG